MSKVWNEHIDDQRSRLEMMSEEACDVAIGAYVADFAYDDASGRVVEDVKGLDLPLGRWKRKHFEAQYGFPVRVIRK